MHAGATRKTVAKSAGVSESTVSRALSGSSLISEETRSKVQKAAESLFYIPNQQASLLARKKTFRLGLVVPYYKSIPTFSRSYFPVLLDGTVSFAEERGYSVTIILDKQGDQFKNLPLLVKRKEIDGLLISILCKEDPRIHDLLQENIPFVLVNSVVENAFCVDNNPEPGMRLAIHYAREMGHQKIGFIAGDMNYHNAGERFSFFRNLAGEFGFDYTIEEGNFSKTSGYYAAGKLLQADPRPTLIMTSSDREALGVLEYCRDHKINIPSDISLIGFDNLDPAGYVYPSLTTINNPIRGVAAEGARLLIDIIEGKEKEPRVVRLDTGFVVRQSSGKAPNENLVNNTNQ